MNLVLLKRLSRVYSTYFREFSWRTWFLAAKLMQLVHPPTATKFTRSLAAEDPRSAFRLCVFVFEPKRSAASSSPRFVRGFLRLLSVLRTHQPTYTSTTLLWRHDEMTFTKTCL